MVLQPNTEARSRAPGPKRREISADPDELRPRSEVDARLATHAFRMSLILHRTPQLRSVYCVTEDSRLQLTGEEMQDEGLL